jgi:hypothetical protein
MEFNPYEAPQAPLKASGDAPAATLDEARRLRLLHLRAESSLRTIGLFWMLSVPVIPTFFYLFTTDERTVWPVFWAFMIPFSSIPLGLGLGLRQLRKGALVTTIIVLGLIILIFAAAYTSHTLDTVYFGIQTLIVVLLLTCLFVVVSPLARKSCTPGYRSAVALTPEIVRPFSLVAKVALVVAVLAIPLVVFASLEWTSPRERPGLPSSSPVEKADRTPQRDPRTRTSVK